MFDPQFNGNDRTVNNNNKLLILSVILFAILALYNPNKGDFVEYKLSYIGEHTLIKSDFLSNVTKLINEPLIESTTKRKNRLFFSVFTTSDNTKYLGIGLFKVIFIKL